MRPIYETEQDRAAQRTALDYAARCWGCRCRHMPDGSLIDGLMFSDDQLMAWVEFKGRSSIRHDAWPTVVLSQRKWDDGLRLSLRDQVPFVVLFGFHDGYWYVFVDPMAGDSHTPKTKITGRWDRDDPFDVEPCVLIEREWFRPLLGG